MADPPGFRICFGFNRNVGSKGVGFSSGLGLGLGREEIGAESLG